jgi:hypothetical protein
MIRYATGRRRPAPGAMNKLETDYADHLALKKAAGHIVDFRYEAVKIRLADNTYYTADFLVIADDWVVELHEVKGYWEDDARVKTKVAAEMYPWFRFVGVTRPKKNDPWKYERFR